MSVNRFAGERGEAKREWWSSLELQYMSKKGNGNAVFQIIGLPLAGKNKQKATK